MTGVQTCALPISEPRAAFGVGEKAGAEAAFGAEAGAEAAVGAVVGRGA